MLRLCEPGLKLVPRRRTASPGKFVSQRSGKNFVNGAFVALAPRNCYPWVHVVDLTCPERYRFVFVLVEAFCVRVRMIVRVCARAVAVYGLETSSTLFICRHVDTCTRALPLSCTEPTAQGKLFDWHLFIPSCIFNAYLTEKL